MRDLDAEDRNDWRRYNGNACPGVTAVQLDGRGDPSYAVALRKLQAGKGWEKVVVLRPGQQGYRSVIMVEPFQQDVVSVVFRLPSGSYKEFYSGRRSFVRHDAIGYGRMGAGSTAYYLSGSKFKSILISD